MIVCMDVYVHIVPLICGLRITIYVTSWGCRRWTMDVWIGCRMVWQCMECEMGWISGYYSGVLTWKSCVAVYVAILIGWTDDCFVCTMRFVDTVECALLRWYA